MIKVQDDIIPGSVIETQINVHNWIGTRVGFVVAVVDPIEGGRWQNDLSAYYFKIAVPKGDATFMIGKQCYAMTFEAWTEKYPDQYLSAKIRGLI